MMKERTKVCKKTRHIHKFSGKVFCSKCNHYLKRNCTEKHEYLVCTSNRDGYKNCENKLAMRYDVLEDIVLNAINDKIDKYYNEAILNEASNIYKVNYKYDDKIKALNKQKCELEKKLEKTKFYLKSLYEDKVSGLITSEQFKELINDYQKSDDKFREQLKAIAIEIDYYKTKETTLKNEKEMLSKYRNLKELNRIIIDEFIESIHIGAFNPSTNSRDIKIKWNLEL
ncbi:MAG: recombinase zinc beta ribbon domain-containing protein [Oscillospiraceae bacterium]|nr:recombinase zinc beta ribbon domain-containing protein [Oscillospiraceae bacterium]